MIARTLAFTFAVILSCLTVARAQNPETVNTRIGKLELEHGVPTKATVDKLYDEMDFERAVQCYLWGIPMVALEELKQAEQQNAGAKSGDIVVYDDYRSKSVILTANATTTYIGSFINLAESGPVVIEYPAGATAGLVDDWWDRPVTDLGIPGPDRGQGAKFLFVGPGQEAPQAEGYRVLHSRTLSMWFGFRVLETDPEKAKALRSGVRIYPYNQRQNPPANRLLTNKPEGELRLGIQPRGLDYWARLSEALNDEPGEDRDRFFMAMLKPLGIENGKPFQPDERQKKILLEAAVVGEAMAKASSFDKRFKGMRYRPDANWDYVIPPDYAVEQDVGNSVQFEERTALFYEAIGMSAGSIPKTPGVGQAYFGLYRDKDGNAFDGGKTYRLRVPANAPVKQFWSFTVYDVDTRCLIQNKEQIADRSSRQDLVKNADGSVDLYFSPKAPAGFEKNWVPTVPGRGWFTYFRLYGPTEAYFDRSWFLPDIENVK
jgi:hypothetical protein